MPEYDYLCNGCGKKFEVFISMRELDSQAAVKCPHCGSGQVKKLITGFFAKTTKKS